MGAAERFLESRGDHQAYMDADCRMPQAWADIVQREFSTYPNLVALSGPFVLATYKYILAIPLTGFSDMIYRKIVIDMLGVVGTLAAVVAMWQGFVYAAAVLGAIAFAARNVYVLWLRPLYKISPAIPDTAARSLGGAKG